MARIVIDKEQCVCCEQCIQACPFGALEMREDGVAVTSACRLCKACVRACPVGAITLEEDE